MEELVRDLTEMVHRIEVGACPFCGHEDPKSTLRNDPETMAEHQAYGGACQKCIDECVEAACREVDCYHYLKHRDGK